MKGARLSQKEEAEGEMHDCTSLLTKTTVTAANCLASGGHPFQAGRQEGRRQAGRRGGREERSEGQPSGNVGYEKVQCLIKCPKNIVVFAFVTSVVVDDDGASNAACSLLFCSCFFIIVIIVIIFITIIIIIIVSRDKILRYLCQQVLF